MGQLSESATDGDLVRQVLSGRTEAYTVLVERYRSEFSRYAAACCGDPDLAADAMQEAFINAFRSLGSCRDPDGFRKWFFRILTNRCHNRRDRRRRDVSIDSVDELAGGEEADHGVARAELRAAIDQAIAGLTPELRETFVMRDIEGRSYAEISGLLDAGEAALRKRVERAREILRNTLEGWL